MLLIVSGEQTFMQLKSFMLQLILQMFQEVFFQLKKAILHHEYGTHSKAYGIALIKVRGELIMKTREWESKAITINKFHYNVEPDTTAIVLGYGLTSEGVLRPETVLYAANVIIQPDKISTFILALQCKS